MFTLESYFRNFNINLCKTLPIKNVLITFLIISLSGCYSGNLNIPLSDNVELRRGIHSAKVVAVIGIPHEQSNIYQEDLEFEIVRVFKESQMFAQVTFNENIPDDIDYLIKFEPAELTYTRYADPLGIALSFATFGMYLIFGGSVVQCTEYYFITLNVSDNIGNHLFNVSIEEDTGHSIGLYDTKDNAKDCAPLHASEFIDKILSELSNQLAPVPEFSE